MSMSDLQTAAATPSDLHAQAAAVSSTAAGEAGVDIRLLESVREFEAAAQLTARIWSDAESKAPASLLRALAHAGNFVAGAFRGDELLGISIGFFGRDAAGTHLHSHITGIDERFQNRSLGFALKQFQRAWALGQGAHSIQWTADPLVRRNLYFNLIKLGATVIAYFPDFYGSIVDGVNGDGASDRVLINWELASDRAVRAADGRPIGSPVEDAQVVLEPDGDGAPVFRPPAAATVLAWVPEDIVQMRRDRPNHATAWREALRRAVGGCLDDGYRAEAITRDGWCILAR
jgi:predicted GNAT superfamily acetyltransferase